MRNKRIQIDNKTINVKQYASCFEKLLIVDMVCETKSMDENGNISYNHMLKEILTEYMIVRAYTDGIIDIDEIDDLSFESVFETYDTLSNQGIIQKVMSNIPARELEMIKHSIEKQIIENQKQPNLLTSLKNLIADLNFDKSEIDELIKSFNNINPDNKDILVEILKNMNNKE